LKSTKSESVSRSHPSLHKTLKRKPTYRDYTEADIKYIWASAKKLGDTSTPKEFIDKFRLTYYSYYGQCYIVESVTDKGTMPVGVVFGNFTGPFLLLENILWLEWATDRNKIETVVNLLNELRKKYLVLFHSNMKDKDFFVHVAKHGIVRRIGTIYNLYDDGKAALFQTR
jgi:hypothetical protein